VRVDARHAPAPDPSPQRRQQGALQSTVVFDCTCGQRWLMRVMQGDVVSVDGEVLDGLKRARDGQVTAPPGSPGAE